MIVAWRFRADYRRFRDLGLKDQETKIKICEWECKWRGEDCGGYTFDKAKNKCFHKMYYITSIDTKVGAAT